MASAVEQIKAKLGIVDVVGSYIQLEKAGLNFKARCPFHNEKTPSFFVSPARNSYYCFGCGAKGDILSFVQQFEGLDFVGALRVLAKQAGVELQRENPTVRTERERQYLLMEHATLFFQRNLAAKAEARDYLTKRGLTSETIKNWRIGYVSADWKSLFEYLKTKGFNGLDIEKVGLIKRSERNANDFYDRFRGRIMFPIFDSSGRVIAFSGRQFESDGTEAKYINSPETVLFEKSKVLYGYDRAKLEIRRHSRAILVEGQMDLIMMHQTGHTNTVASSGTALTREQLELIRRLAPKITIAYDADEAGANAAARGWQLALETGLDVEIATLAGGKDPADIAKDDPAGLEQSLKNARHIIDVELDRIVAQTTDARERGLAVQKILVPLLANIQSAIEQSHFIGTIALKTGIKEAGIYEEVRKRAKNSLEKQDSPTSGAVKNRGSRREAIARMIWGIYFWQQKVHPANPDPLDIYKKIGKITSEDQAAKDREAQDNQKDELIFEAEVSFQNSADLSHHVTELFRNYEEEWLRDEFAKAMRDLQLAEQAKDTDKILSYLKRCQELSLRIRELTQESK